MIRHIVLLRLNAAATATAVEQIRAELAGLEAPGRTAFWMGPDLGLRAGNMDVGIVNDFVDADAYRAFDTNAEHDRIRRDLIAPITERAERCQFDL